MFKRLLNLIKGFLSLLIAGMEKRNLDALIALEKENLRKQIAKESDGLNTLNTLRELFTNQVKKLETQAWDLRTKTMANLRAGNRELAGESALQLQIIHQQLEDNRHQLTLVETAQKNLFTAYEQVAKVAGRDRTGRSNLFSSVSEAEKRALSEAALLQFITDEDIETPKALTGPKIEQENNKAAD